MDETGKSVVMQNLTDARDRISDVLGSGCCSQFDEMLAEAMRSLADAVEAVVRYA